MQRRHERPRSAIVVAGALAVVTLTFAVAVVAPLLGYDLPLRTAVVLATARDNYQVTSPIELAASPRVVLEHGTLSLAPRGGRKPRSAKEALALIESGRAQLVLEDALLSVDARGPRATAGAGATAEIAPILSALAQFRFGSLKIRRGTLVLNAGAGAREVLGEISADFAAVRSSAVSAIGSFNLRGEELSFDTILDLAVDPSDGRAPLKATITGALVQASFDGRVGFADGLQLAANVADVRCARLRELARWLGAPWPAGSGLQDFRARGQLEWQEGVLAFQEAVFQMDGNVASGALSVGLGERTAIDGTLALARLDLTAYLPPAAGASKDTRTRLEAAWLALTGDPVDYAFPLIKELDADIRISADRVVARGNDFGRGAATLSIRDGKMLADVAELELGHGALGGGHVMLDMNGPVPHYVVRGKLAGFEAARLGAAVFDYPPLLSGRGEVSLDLAATGATRTELAGTLAGKIMLHVGDGGRLGIDLEALMAAARAKELAGWAAGRGSTTVDEIVARFRVSGGTIGVEAVKLQTGGRSIVGSGGIDFANRELDVQLMLAPPAPAVAPGAREAPAADRLSVQGPWIAPAIRWIAATDKAALPVLPTGGTRLAAPVDPR
jgi:AsmA protein